MAASKIRIHANENALKFDEKPNVRWKLHQKNFSCAESHFPNCLLFGKLSRQSTHKKYDNWNKHNNSLVYKNNIYS